MKPFGSRAGTGLGLVASGLLALTVYGFAAHPGFVPVYLVRTVAPIVALLAGASFTHLVARQRLQVDVPGEFNPAGRALFLGVVMLVVTLLAWLAVAQAAPALWTAAFGVHRVEAGIVVQRIPLAPGPECRYRLEVTGPSVSRPMDECVSIDLWNQSAAGDPVSVDLISSAFGSEIVGVRPGGGG